MVFNFIDVQVTLDFVYDCRGQWRYNTTMTCCLLESRIKRYTRFIIYNMVMIYNVHHCLIALLLCSQWFNDSPVTLNLCITTGLLVECLYSFANPFLANLSLDFGLKSTEFSLSICLSSAILEPIGRTSSPNSSCKSLVIASFTSNLRLSISALILLVPKMISMSSFTGCPGTTNHFDINMMKEIFKLAVRCLSIISLSHLACILIT